MKPDQGVAGSIVLPLGTVGAAKDGRPLVPGRRGERAADADREDAGIFGRKEKLPRLLGAGNSFAMSREGARQRHCQVVDVLHRPPFDRTVARLPRDGMDDPLVEQRLREGNRRFGGGVEAGGMRGAARGTAQVEQQKQRTLDGASRLPDHQVVIFGGQLPVDLTQRVPFTVFPDLVDLADILSLIHI